MRIRWSLWPGVKFWWSIFKSVLCRTACGLSESVFHSLSAFQGVSGGLACPHGPECLRWVWAQCHKNQAHSPRCGLCTKLKHSSHPTSVLVPFWSPLPWATGTVVPGSQTNHTPQPHLASDDPPSPWVTSSCSQFWRPGSKTRVSAGPCSLRSPRGGSFPQAGQGGLWVSVFLQGQQSGWLRVHLTPLWSHSPSLISLSMTLFPQKVTSEPLGWDLHISFWGTRLHL